MKPAIQHPMSYVFMALFPQTNRCRINNTSPCICRPFLPEADEPDKEPPSGDVRPGRGARKHPRRRRTRD